VRHGVVLDGDDGLGTPRSHHFVDAAGLVLSGSSAIHSRRRFQQRTIAVRRASGKFVEHVFQFWAAQPVSFRWIAGLLTRPLSR
jgi:hypothetical protein